MAKHTNKEAYFERLKNLAEVNKPALKESKIRNLGSLIDYKRAADGVAYGIVKENHNYFLKVGGTKQDPDVADFAYIGGLANITGFKYPSLAEADKQRNMIFHTINEAVTTKVDKNGSKKKKLNEDKAGEEIDQAASKVGDLDAATSAEAQPAEPVAGPEGGDEMAAGMSAKPAGETSAEEPAPTDEVPPAEDSTPAEEPALSGDEELPPAEDTGEPAPEGPALDGDEEEGAKDEIKSDIGKIGEKVQEKTLDDKKVVDYVNMFLGYFKDNFVDMPIEDRKELAKKILEVTKDQNIDDLEQTMPSEPVTADGGVGGVEEEQEPCAECGSLPEYAKSRGYDTAQSFMECDDEEKANVISGYANAHNDGMNDGDFKTVAIVITPEILEKLKGDYGHDEYANKVEPFANEMNESSDEDKMAQLNELWGGLGNAFKKVGGDIKAGAQKAGQAVGNVAKAGAQAVGGAVQKGAQAVGNVAKAGAQKVGQYATNVKQAYNAGEVPAEVQKLQATASDLGKRIEALNKRMVGSGQPPIDVKTILKAVTQQVTGKGAGIGGLNPAVAESVGVDPSNVQVSEPNMIKEGDKKVAPLNTVVSEPNMIKEADDELEKPEGLETDSPEHEAGETPAEEKAEHEEGGEEFNVEEPFEKSGDKPLSFGPDSQSLGVGTVKPDGAGVEISIEPDKTVNISMNESEVKLRKYVRIKLEELAGKRKPSLNESKKSPVLKKLDAVIAEQFKLYEGVILKKKGKLSEGAVNEIFGWSIAEKFAKLDPNDEAGVKALFQEAFKNILINPHMSVIGTAANRATTQEKYALLQQFVQGGGGTLRLDKAGKLIYASKEFQDKGTPGQFKQGGTMGKTALGGV